MSSKLLFSDNSLYNSDVCRLCGEKNSNGEFLYTREDEENALGALINRYLPVKVTPEYHQNAPYLRTIRSLKINVFTLVFTYVLLFVI